MEKISLQSVTLQKIAVRFTNKEQLNQLLKNKFFSQNSDFENQDHSKHIEWWFSKCKWFKTHCPGHMDMHVNIQLIEDYFKPVGSQIIFTFDADNKELAENFPNILKGAVGAIDGIGEKYANAISFEKKHGKRFEFEISGSAFIEVFQNYYGAGSLTLGHARDIVYKLKPYKVAVDHSPVGEDITLKYKLNGEDEIKFQVTIEDDASKHDVSHFLELMSLEISKD